MFFRSMYVLEACSEKAIYLAIYVDDLFIASNDSQLLAKEKAMFATKFDMHDLGEANFILGMKISRDRATRRLSIN